MIEIHSYDKKLYIQIFFPTIPFLSYILLRIEVKAIFSYIFTQKKSCKSHSITLPLVFKSHNRKQLFWPWTWKYFLLNHFLSDLSQITLNYIKNEITSYCYYKKKNNNNNNSVKICVFQRWVTELISPFCMSNFDFDVIIIMCSIIW